MALELKQGYYKFSPAFDTLVWEGPIADTLSDRWSRLLARRLQHLETSSSPCSWRRQEGATIHDSSLQQRSLDSQEFVGMGR